MAPSPNPPVRRPLIAGVLFGLFLASLRGHWDALERTHDILAVGISGLLRLDPLGSNQ